MAKKIKLRGSYTIQELLQARELVLKLEEELVGSEV